MTDFLNVTLDAFPNEDIKKEELFVSLKDNWFSTVKIRTLITGRKAAGAVAPLEKKQ